MPAPIDMYDAVHAETMKHSADGLTMHLARKVDVGFQVIEVWESKEQHDRFNADLVWPIVITLAGADAAGPAPEEFDVHTLVVSSAGID